MTNRWGDPAPSNIARKRAKDVGTCIGTLEDTDFTNLLPIIREAVPANRPHIPFFRYQGHIVYPIDFRGSRSKSYKILASITCLGKSFPTSLLLSDDYYPERYRYYGHILFSDSIRPYFEPHIRRIQGE